MSALLLNLTDLSSEPLHGQISRQIRARILAHELTDEAPLPSIRVMARQQRVSVITVKRAYEDLLAGRSPERSQLPMNRSRAHLLREVPRARWLTTALAAVRHRRRYSFRGPTGHLRFSGAPSPAIGFRSLTFEGRRWRDLAEWIPRIRNLL